MSTDPRPIIHEYWIVRVWPKNEPRDRRWYLLDWAEVAHVNRWHAGTMTKLQAKIARDWARSAGHEVKVIHVTTREKAQ